MKKIVIAALAGIVGCGAAGATTLTFDDYSTDSSGEIMDGYGMLHWSNVDFLYVPHFTGMNGVSGYSNGEVSPNYVAYNGMGDPATISADYRFTLNSAYFTGAWNDGLSVTATGYSGTTAAYTTTFTVDTTAPVLETFDWANLSSVTFSSTGGTKNSSYATAASGANFVLDNLSFTPAIAHPFLAQAAVPEMSTWAIMVGGFGVLGAAMRRKGFARARAA